MNLITQPTNLPTWFTNANINAKFSAKEIATLLQTSSSFVREHLRKQESFESIGNHRPSAQKPTKYFSKKVVLEFIATLPKRGKEMTLMKHETTNIIIKVSNCSIIPELEKYGWYLL